jgi:hypothetical protein
MIRYGLGSKPQCQIDLEKATSKLEFGLRITPRAGGYAIESKLTYPAIGILKLSPPATGFAESYVFTCPTMTVVALCRVTILTDFGVCKDEPEFEILPAKNTLIAADAILP